MRILVQITLHDSSIHDEMCCAELPAEASGDQIESAGLALAKIAIQHARTKQILFNREEHVKDLARRSSADH